MITPLSSRSFHTIRYYADTIKDTITNLFFEVLGCFNNSFQKHSEYYANKITNRHTSLFTNANDQLIHNTFNWVHPRKISKIPLFVLNNPNFQIAGQRNPLGFCHGMSVDFTRRLRASDLPFFETISQLTKKFENGCTKKAYITQMIFSSVIPTLNALDNFGINENATEIPPETVCTIRDDLFNSLNLGFKTKYLKHEFTKENHAAIPNGDYLLYYWNGPNPAHVICLNKRDEGCALFDPNFGTYFFSNSDPIYEFINITSKKIFDGNILFGLHRCI